LSSFKSDDDRSTGQLWIEFLDFFSIRFEVLKFVVSIRKVGGIPKVETKWQGKKLTIEGKFSLLKQVSSFLCCIVLFCCTGLKF
jgi:hypothetical protein